MGELQRLDVSLMVDVNHLAWHTAWLHTPLVLTRIQIPHN